VAPADAEDTLFFDLMWADPRAADGVGLSAVRGAGAYLSIATNSVVRLNQTHAVSHNICGLCVP